MALEIVDIAYDPIRNTSRLNRNVQQASNPKDSLGRYSPTPYKITFQLSIFTRYEDDLFQIIEQIIPYFKPDFVCRIEELHDSVAGKEQRSVPINLSAVMPIEDWDQAPNERRRIEWSMTFIMDAQFYPPLEEIDGEIRTVYLDFHQQEKELDPKGNFESFDIEREGNSDKIEEGLSSNIPIPTGDEKSGIRGKHEY